MSPLPLLLVVFVAGVAGLPRMSHNTDKHPYLSRARELVDKYLETRQEMDKRGFIETVRPKAERMMRAHNRLNKRTKDLQEESKRINLEIDALALMALGEDENDNIMRELAAIHLAKRADVDSNCNRVVTCDDTEMYRSADGTCNNLDNPLWGSAGIQHLRLLDNAYDNGIWKIRSKSAASGGGVRKEIPAERDISNAVHRYTGELADPMEDTPVKDDVSQMLWSWGQFLAHDVIETPEGDIRNVDCCNQTSTSKSPFCMPIEIETGDSYFTDGICMPAVRSFTVLTCDEAFQNQINQITAYIDASNVYGSSDDETSALRSGTAGFLITSTAKFPPNDTSEDAVCDRQETKYCAKTGDTRGNVIATLTTLQTLFVREHNRIADYLNDINSDWDDETIFQETRKIVAAEMQHITYNEFLPTLLSAETMQQYRLTVPDNSYAYEQNTDASVFNSFSIAFRGHSMIPPRLKFFNSSFQEVGSPVSTTDAYLHPHYLFWKNYGGIDEIASWIVGSKCPMADRYMENTARNELFKSGNIMFDLASLNIKRGREWGTPSYTKFRTLCGLADGVTDWAWSDFTDHSDTARAALEDVYEHPEDVDLYTGIASENLLGSSMTGPTASCLIGKQYEALRYGDRFWYETSETSSGGVNLGFSGDQLTELRKISLSKVLCDNLSFESIQENAFRLGGDLVSCDDLPSVNLNKWKE